MVTVLAGRLLYNSQGSRSPKPLVLCTFLPVLTGHLSRTATLCGPGAFLLHLSMAIHCPVLEVSDVLLSQVFVGEPVNLSLAVELAVSEVTLVLDSSGLLGELTPVNNNSLNNNNNNKHSYVHPRRLAVFPVTLVLSILLVQQ